MRIRPFGLKQWCLFMLTLVCFGIIRPQMGLAGVPLVAQPDTLDYGVVAIPATLDLSFTLSNTSNSQIQIDNLVIAGGNASGDFTILSPTTTLFVLPPNNFKTIIVHFSPNSVGSRSSVLQVLSSAGELDVSLFGIGIDTNAGITVRPDNIDLGDVAVGTSKDTTFYFVALGPDSVLIDNLSVAEFSGSVDFAVQLKNPNQQLPLFLSKGDSLGVLVHFTATDPAGPRQCDVAAVGDGIGKMSCAITANVAKPGMLVLPDSINFGAVYRGVVIDTFVTIYSTDNVPLTVTDLELSGITGAQLLNAPSVPFTIPGHDSLKLHLRFNPADTGRVVVALIIIAGETFNGSSFDNVWLLATVKDAPLAITKLPSIDYYCAIDSELERTITISDTTNVPIQISNVLVSDSAIRFSNLPAFPYTLAPGKSFDLKLLYKRANDSNYVARIDVLGGDVVLRSDTILLQAHTSASQLYSKPVQIVGHGLITNEVFATEDLTKYGLTSLDILVASQNQDASIIDPTSFRSNTTAFPGSTVSQRLLPDGKTYDVTLSFLGKLDFKNSDISKTWLLTYDVSTFTTIAKSSLISTAAISIEKSGCLDFASDSITSEVPYACGDSVLRAILSQQPIFGSASISPNPVVKGAATLRLDLREAADLTISIVGSDGILRSSNSISTTGATSLSLPLELRSLSSGSYQALIECRTAAGGFSDANLKFILSR